MKRLNALGDRLLGKLAPQSVGPQACQTYACGRGCYRRCCDGVCGMCYC
ncbi:hypothetical protein LX16_4564 [Stackebrandtia albiflava]|uniref:Uncharacterized protein n=1 Tax=Stackebrandtia albiflava TaxID=406432 RepID=A0A562URU7_9ACTN|nr:hypothetical protein [Stackebrandtia albiflava]TWJ08336.1 hypothetical protein LX16_4564 [Stackebrandtia albiflava]